MLRCLFRVIGSGGRHQVSESCINEFVLFAHTVRGIIGGIAVWSIFIELAVSALWFLRLFYNVTKR